MQKLLITVAILLSSVGNTCAEMYICKPIMKQDFRQKPTGGWEKWEPFSISDGYAVRKANEKEKKEYGERWLVFMMMDNADLKPSLVCNEINEYLKCVGTGNFELNRRTKRFASYYFTPFLAATDANSDFSFEVGSCDVVP